MLARCPNNREHKRFITTILEKHDAIVSETGKLIEEISCVDVVEGPDSENIWVCNECKVEVTVED
jgi:hypothetical protein